jgi:hypothetical protein
VNLRSRQFAEPHPWREGELDALLPRPIAPTPAVGRVASLGQSREVRLWSPS